MKTIIPFIRQKDFIYLKEIGQGGTGRTVLLKDELINEEFVCKKYSPFDENDTELYYTNFVEEIKLLHLVYHRNIVRIFNHYLYPKNKTGYIIMEYVKGLDIQEYSRENPDKINDIFIQTIEGFRYLQQMNILHRDIRPQNILISTTGTVKIIDFGFGKKILFDKDFGKSITLNWRYSAPDEFSTQTYDFRTEIYFIGRLFEEIIKENNIQSFGYLPILKEMTAGYNTRVESFFEISRSITHGENVKIQFSNEQKQIYRIFADSLSNAVDRIDPTVNYITDLDLVVQHLDNLYRSSILEDCIHNIGALITCFLKGNYSYYTGAEINVEDVNNFKNFIKSLSPEKKKIVINNLWGRLDRKKRSVPISDDLPF